MSATDLTKAGDKFRHGDALTDQEVTDLISDIEIGMTFLKNRGETGGVLFKAYLDRESLRSFQYARRGA